jgi:hypothetical protein
MLKKGMGFYVRKSVSVGPFRFNLSKSGIGVSTGIKGFRVGTGPRGNYVQMGYGGIYFRQTFPTEHRHRQQYVSPQPSSSPQSNIQFQEIESGNVSRMVDSSSSALLQEINSKSKKLAVWPWVLSFSVFVFVALAAGDAPSWPYWVFGPLCSIGLGIAIYADKLRKTVVLFYELEPQVESAYQNIHATFTLIKNCGRFWHIDSRGFITTTYDWKVNAGADAIVKRRIIGPRFGLPPYFKSNILVPILPARGRTFYFFPDRVLVWNGRAVGAVDYKELNISYSEQRFIESESVPHDTRIVDKTWKYVNKKGGPDRRFNNNHEIPIVIYEGILLSSKSGVQELFHCSRTSIGATLKAAVEKIAAVIVDSAPCDPAFGYMKSPCNNCGVQIEFPAHGVGQTIICPSCGMETCLNASTVPIN